MDRVIVYPGALPQTTDILNTNKFMMVGQAHQNRSILGTNTVVSGLACTPTSPTADLHVTVGVGALYQMDPTDQTAYGDLSVDNISIMKQGILNAPVSLSITPPGTAGFSQVFLVQAILNDVDAGQLTLSYFNSAVPTAPYSGPANSGTSNFTTRTNPCVIALKAGTAATTGTQATPAPDVGYVGLFAVTVANGQTQITSPNIVQLPTAPFFPTLPSVPGAVQSGSWVYVGTDTGAANAYVISFVAGQPIPAAYVAGMGLKFKALVTNTGVSTINVNGLGLITIKRANGAGLAAGDITSGQIVELTYDGTFFQMVNYLGTGTNTNTNTTAGIPYIADSGAVNALIGTFSPPITSGQQVAGLTLAIKLANTITGACTINVNGLGLKSVTTGDLQNPPNGVFVVGEVLILEYDGTQYQIANTSSLTYRKPSANTTIFVNNAIGNDANDGVSNTAGHALATIQGGVNKAFGYAPSQFTITVVVEPGTYNENVATPLFAGPNVIIDGLAAASVTVNGGSGQYCFLAQGPNTLTVKNVTVQNNGIYPNLGFGVGSGATLTTTATVSNACSIVFYANTGGTLNPGTHTFSGSGYAAFYATIGGSIVMGTTTYTISTSISYSGAGAAFVFVGAGFLTINNVNPPTFVNPSFVSGLKFDVGLNGVISANTLGVNFLPGTIAGITQTGGQVNF